ncbi:MAG: 4Fe-4S dicluster domain-containing protein [Methanomassiliicoccales archaeon]|nr:MAG: 4Fe-4S dicluster domain-containing protein [Methanomassiliicoccales archaeon]
MANSISPHDITRHVRRTVLGAEWPLKFEDERFLLCHQCSQCSGVCPSQRQGGINPREIMMRYTSGLADPADNVLWLCTMCHSCVERCQLDVRPAELITRLREEGAIIGSIPRSFQEEARLFMRTGLSFPSTGLTKKIRREMGLDELLPDARAMKDINVIVASTRLGRVKLD